MYGTCDISQEIKNGKDVDGPTESISTGGTGISGGGPTSASLHLEVPPGFRLGDVQEHCLKNVGDNPCAFVIPQPVGNPPFSIAGRPVDWTPSNNSDSATVWITASRTKVIEGFDEKSGGSIKPQYGKTFSVAFPNVALDVKLKCEADGDSRIYSLSDMGSKGELIYISGVRESTTGKLFDLAVAPYDVSE